MQDTLTLRLRAMTWEAEGILGLELVPAAPGTPLPAFTAGAHIDLHLPGGPVRSYSLLNDPAERHRWCIAVHRDPASRGGSRQVHEQLRPGQLLTVSPPRNHFPLDEAAPRSVFIAGGIGITPLLCMVRRLTALGRPWVLHHAARTRAHAAFGDELQALAAHGGGTLHRVFDQEPGGRMLDVAAIVAALPDGAHVYCCGPAGMLAAFERATAGLPPQRVHLEYFAAKDAPAATGGFSVKLQRDGRTVPVPPGQSILDALAAIGAEPPWSCREGVCGTCEVRVLDGVPDHHDMVLSPAQREANDRMMVCCSGAKSPLLVLDL
jgi:tetrachlorobenzoquinone reductase